MTEELDPVGALRTAALVLAATLAVAAIVAAGFAATVRGWLGFTFPGVPATFGEARDIFINNIRLATGVAAAALVAQSASRARSEDAERARRCGSLPLRGVALTVDLALAVAVAVNVAVVGASLGAYGAPMATSVLPHGPVELLGYCVVLDLHRRARRGGLTRRAWVAALIATVALLAASAALEAFVPIS